MFNMTEKSQLMKGILEGCLLALIKQEDKMYGYEFIVHLEKRGFHFVSEGSIYPVLLRMQKKYLIRGTMQKSPSGPDRKYYHLTDEGEQALLKFILDWREVERPVERLLESINDKK